MSIESRIQTILTKRKDKVQGYSTILQQLSSCHELISEAKQAAYPIIQHKAFDGDNKVAELSNVVSELIKLDKSPVLDNLKAKVLHAKQRCGRSYINIGILAPWRHGKSQFLCQIFRLKPDEEKYLIPTDSDKQRACTGTTVNYLNGDSNICVFEKFSEKEVITAILDLCRLSEIPTDNLQSMSLDELMGFLQTNYINDIKDANENTPRQALREYIEGYDDYKEIIQNGVESIEFTLGGEQPDPKLLEIYQYICFYSTPNDKNEHNNFKCLGLKRVSISMPLVRSTGESLGKIRFLDTPGLGESRPNVETNITNILKEDVDIVICVCQTNKYVDSGDFDKFNSFLCTDFNVEYIGTDKEKHDASKSVHYILNVNQEESTVKRDIYEARNQCIIDSMKSINKGYRIQISDSHIHVLDAKNDVNIVLLSVLSDNENKKYYEYTVGDSNACIHMLEECLSSLENDIQDVDNFFNREADNAVIELKNYLSDVRLAVFNMKLPQVSSGALQHSLLDNLVNEFKKANLLRSDNDQSVIRLNEFVGRGSADITGEFLSKISKQKQLSNYASITDVVTGYKDSQIVLSDTMFSQLLEMSQYANLKRNFQQFYSDKLSDCLDIEGIKGNIKSVASLIVESLITAFKPVLGEDTIEDNLIQRLNALKDEQPACGTIAEFLAKVLDAQVVYHVVNDYVAIDLCKYFHKEQSNHEIGKPIGLTRSAVATTFIYWIDNICNSLNKAVIATDTPGVASFSSLVEGIYKNYEKDVLENFYLANNPHNKLGHAMCDFYSDNIDKLGNIDKLRELVTRWNTVYEKLRTTL